MWADVNDLDLYVICPCGTQLYHGTKNCATCGGIYEFDTNAGSKNNATAPIEHVFFNMPKAGAYKIRVNYCSQKTTNGVTGPERSMFSIAVSDKQGHVYLIEQTSVEKGQKSQEFVYNHK